MGQIDIENLFRIYDEANKIIKKHNLYFHFTIDHGSYETAIEFIDKKCFHPPISKNWDTNPDILCPDLLDWNYKIIIEYEEEVGNKRAGAKLAKKGHNREGDLDNKRDLNRNNHYNDFGFNILRIWESDNMWESDLEKFLLSINNN